MDYDWFLSPLTLRTLEAMVWGNREQGVITMWHNDSRGRSKAGCAPRFENLEGFSRNAELFKGDL